MASLYFTPSVLAAAPLGKGSLDYMLWPNNLNHGKKKKKKNTEEHCLEVKMKSEAFALGSRPFLRAGEHLLLLCIPVRI